MDQNDDDTTSETTPVDPGATGGAAPTPEADAPAGGDASILDDAGPGPAPTDAPEPAVEATVPAEEPVDGAPTPLAAPAEGPVTAAAHDVSHRPKPVRSKVTPVLAVVAVAWVIKKLLSRSRP
jgi:hypothetical protein